jgi:alkylresorcinol/alkylpyrone synthase
MSGALISGALITGAASARPPSRTQDDLWDGFFAGHFSQNRWAGRVFAASGVERRHCVVDPTKEDLSEASTGRRMERYVEEAVPLATEAVAGALAAAGLAAGDVGLLTVVSCTGYATPGVDLHVATALGFDPRAQRLVVGHMGCHGALPGLGAVGDYAAARGRPAVLVCVELSSLHLQPAPEGRAAADFEQVVAHSLFSDAASAVVVEPAGSVAGRAARQPSGAGGFHAVRGLEVVDITAVTDADAAGLMTWQVTDMGFRMGLSRRVPDVLARHVRPLVDDLLARNGVARDEVEAWAVHPGGPRILDVAGEHLELDDGDLAESRRVLAEDGNCSSATVLLVLEEIRRRNLTSGRYVVALAFGPGLTLYAALLRSA